MFESDGKDKLIGFEREKLFQSILEEFPNLTAEQQQTIMRNPLHFALKSGVEINNSVFPKFLEKMKADLETRLNTKQEDKKPKGKITTRQPKTDKPKKMLHARQLLKNMQRKAHEKTKKRTEEEVKEAAKISESGTETAESSDIFDASLNENIDVLSGVSTEKDSSYSCDVALKEKSDVPIKSLHDRPKVKERSKRTDAKANDKPSVELSKKTGMKSYFSDHFNKLKNMRKKPLNGKEEKFQLELKKKKKGDSEHGKTKEKSEELKNEQSDATISEKEKEASTNVDVQEQDKSRPYYSHFQLRTISEDDENERKAAIKVEKAQRDDDESKEEEEIESERKGLEPQRKNEKSKREVDDKNEKKIIDRRIIQEDEESNVRMTSSKSSDSKRADRKPKLSFSPPLAISESAEDVKEKGRSSSLCKYSKSRLESSSDHKKERKSVTRLHFRFDEIHTKCDAESDGKRKEIESEHKSLSDHDAGKSEEKENRERAVNEKGKTSSEKLRKTRKVERKEEEKRRSEENIRRREKEEEEEKEEESEKKWKKRRKKRRKRRRRDSDSNSERRRRRRSEKEKRRKKKKTYADNHERSDSDSDDFERESARSEKEKGATKPYDDDESESDSGDEERQIRTTREEGSKERVRAKTEHVAEKQQASRKEEMTTVLTTAGITSGDDVQKSEKPAEKEGEVRKSEIKKGVKERDKTTKEVMEKRPSVESETALRKVKKKDFQKRDATTKENVVEKKSEFGKKPTYGRRESDGKKKKVLIFVKGRDEDKSVELDESGAEIQRDVQRYKKMKQEQEKEKKRADDKKKKADEKKEREKKKRERRQKEENKIKRIRRKHEKERREMEKKEMKLKKEEARLVSMREDFLEIAQRLLNQSPEKRMARRFLQSEDTHFASILHDRLALKQQLIRSNHRESDFDHVIFEMTKDSQPLDMDAVKKAFNHRFRRRCDACSEPVQRLKRHREFRKDNSAEFLTCEVCAIGLSEAYEHVLRDLEHERTLNIVLQNWSYADAAEVGIGPLQVSGMATPPGCCAAEGLLTECLRNVEYEELLRDIADVVVDIKELLRKQT